MKKYVVILFLLITSSVYSQTPLRIPQRAFNYSLSYGSRNKNTFYAVGCGFSSKNSVATMELGIGKLALGLHMFSPNIMTINGRPDELYVTGNYVYRNKKYNRLLLMGGLGSSVDGKNKMILRIGGDLQLSYPLYLSIHYYQTDISRVMFGLKMIIF
jgi:hypothetical protein